MTHEWHRGPFRRGFRLCCVVTATACRARDAHSLRHARLCQWKYSAARHQHGDRHGAATSLRPDADEYADEHASPQRSPLLNVAVAPLVTAAATVSPCHLEKHTIAPNSRCCSAIDLVGMPHRHERLDRSEESDVSNRVEHSSSVSGAEPICALGHQRPIARSNPAGLGFLLPIGTRP